MYQLIETLPDGHRLFTRSGYGGILIADESGDTPDQTDDGDLWLDMTRYLLIEQTYCDIPLHNIAGKPTRTPTDPATIFKLAVRFGWRVNVATKVDSVAYDVSVATTRSVQGA